MSANYSGCTVTVGVSLELLGEDLPSDSFVNVNDLLNVPAGGQELLSHLNLPTLHCFTDRVDCCSSHQPINRWMVLFKWKTSVV